jgi:hypothetical protein
MIMSYAPTELLSAAEAAAEAALNASQESESMIRTSRPRRFTRQLKGKRRLGGGGAGGEGPEISELMFSTLIS